MQRLQALAEDDEGEEANVARDADAGIGAGERGHLGGWWSAGENRGGGQQQERGREHKQQRQDHAPLDAAGDALVVAGPDRMGDHRVERHEGAHAEDRGPEVVDIAERHGRERLGGDVTDHDGVDHSHGHHPHLHHDDRQSEGEQCPKRGARRWAEGHGVMPEDNGLRDPGTVSRRRARVGPAGACVARWSDQLDPFAKPSAAGTHAGPLVWDEAEGFA